MKKIVLLCFVFPVAAVTLRSGPISEDVKFFRDDPAKYWDVPSLMKVPHFRPNPFPDSDTPGMKSFLVAGKGHEDYQILANETIHFDDREKVKEIFG